MSKPLLRIDEPYIEGVVLAYLPEPYYESGVIRADLLHQAGYTSVIDASDTKGQWTLEVCQSLTDKAHYLVVNTDVKH